MTVTNSEPAAQARFLYINGSSGGLSQLPNPSSLMSLITSPVTGKIYKGLQRDFLTTYNRPNVEDESVDAFFTRRFGPEFARTFASALVHGMYAADSRKLSLRAAYPMLWNAEAYGGGSVVWGVLKPKPKRPVDDSYELGSSLPELMKDAAVYNFKDGLSTLPNALAEALKSRSNVEIRMGDPVSSVNLGEPFSVRCRHIQTSLKLGLIYSRLLTGHNKVRVGRITDAYHLSPARQTAGRYITCRQHRT